MIDIKHKVKPPTVTLLIQIKEQHRGDQMTSGPKSHLLAGIVVDTIPGPVSAHSSLVVFVTFPPRAIRHSPVLVQAFIMEDEEHTLSLPPNPFNHLTEEVLKEYKSLVQQKRLGQDGTYFF